MRTTVGKSLISSLTAVGLLMSGSARADIALQDGSLSQAYTSTATTVSASFTVTPGASVLVVSLYTRDNVNSTAPWPGSVTWNGTPLTQAVSQNNLGSTYADSVILYLWNPTPGTGTILATDSSGNVPSQFVIQPFTLNGVNTNDAPLTVSAGNGSSSSLQITLPSATPLGGWAVVNGVYSTGVPGVFVTETGGIPVITDFVNAKSEPMGCIENLPAGTGYVTINAGPNNNGSQQQVIEAAIFTPVSYSQPAAPVGQIALQDGGTYIYHVGGVSTVSTLPNFTVTPGASVLVVNVATRDSVNNGNGTNNAVVSPFTWNGNPGDPQPFILAYNENNGAQTYLNCSIYYIFNPNPGTAAITVVDPAGSAPSALDIQAFTMSGVDTNALPVTTGASNTSTVTISTTATDIQGGAWAIVNSSFGSGDTVMFDTSSSGTAVIPEVDNTTSQAMGYVANLGPGVATVTANAGSGQSNQKMNVATAVFVPAAFAGPAVPINFVAQSAVANEVPLSWSDGSGGQATGYVLERSTTSDTGFTPIATNNGVASTSFNDTNVIAYTAYYYVVQAIDASGAGPFTAQVSATPTGLAAPPSNVTATAGLNQVTLSWVDTSGGIAQGFVILRSTTSGGPYTAIASYGGVGLTSYTDTQVYDGTTYYYVVETVNLGGPGPNSAQASATPFTGAPGLPGSIALLDGGISTLTTVTGASDISASFTVSQEASVMVVELWDQNNQNNHSSPAFLTWANSTTGTSQNLIRAVSANSASGTLSDSDIYYLFNPAPGSGTVSGTDTNAIAPAAMTMMVFDLQGVDTTRNPVAYAVNSSSATTLSVETYSSTPAGAWAAALSFDANAGSAINNASTSGTWTQQNQNNIQEQNLAYVSGLAAGSNNVSMTDSGAATEASLAVAVFAPAIGTGIYLHDGSINSETTALVNSGNTEPLTITQGASVLVVELFDFNNNNTAGTGFDGYQDPGPTNLVWSNITTGVTYPISPLEAIWVGYGVSWVDVYYLLDPAPGAGVVTGSDPGTGSMAIQTYTLGGVDTTATPYTTGFGDGNNTNITLTTSSTEVQGSWAAVISDQYNGGGGNNITITGSSGGGVENNPRPDGLQCTMGYLTNLGPGAQTITSLATGSTSHMNFGLAVFQPLPGTLSPSSVTAAQGLNQIMVSWVDGSGGAATGYLLLRSTSAGGTFSVIATNNGNGNTSYTDTNVIAYIPYYYIVEAVGPSGLGLASTAQGEAYAQGVPLTPTGLTAQGQPNSVLLNWNAQNGVTDFNIYRSATAGSAGSIISTSPTTTFTDSSVTDGLLYYYEISAANNNGTSANSSQVAAVPCVVLFTNWISIFNSTAPLVSIPNWNLFVGTNTNMVAQSFNSNPGYGPSAGCMVLQGQFGPTTTDDDNGMATNFAQINVSTYPNLEFDLTDFGSYDQNNQIQDIYPNLQVSVGGHPTYERGTYNGATILASTGIGTWTHYVIPVSDWSAYNLATLTGLGIEIFDDNAPNSAVMTITIGVDNIEFSGAPGWASSFSGLANKTNFNGTASVTLTGTVSGLVAGTNIYLANGTLISVTINGSTQTTAINGASGAFSINFNTTGFGNATYPVKYVAAADNVALIGATNSATSLTIIPYVAPTAPAIAAPKMDSTGTNVIVIVPTQSGYNYYLLSTTNLAPPVVWTTNTTTAGTGATITNLVPIRKSPADLYLKYLVQ